MTLRPQVVDFPMTKPRLFSTVRHTIWIPKGTGHLACIETRLQFPTLGVNV
jgi:hypothetical protein